MNDERDVSYPMESSRQAFVFGALLIGYGIFRLTMALPDPGLTGELEGALMLWIQTSVGVLGLLAGCWLLQHHRAQRLRAATTLDATRRTVQGLHALLEDLQGFGRALVDVGPRLARDVEDAQREHLEELRARVACLAEAHVRNGAFVAEAIERVDTVLNQARSAAIDQRGEAMISHLVAAEKHLKKALEALEG